MSSANVIQGSFPNGVIRMQPVQRMAAPAARQMPNGVAMPLPPTFAPTVHAGGQPLTRPVLQRMEALFGATFADVRVHVGPDAARLGAQAFTHGSHIYFAPGHYDPNAPRGVQMLARELAHVVQQRAGRVRNPFGSGVALVQDRMLDLEAERMAIRSSTMPAPQQVQAVQRTVARPGVVQRCTSCSDSNCQEGSKCRRAWLQTQVPAAAGGYTRAVGEVNADMSRRGVGITQERATAIARNMQQVANGGMSSGTAHVGEVVGLGRDMITPGNGLSPGDRVWAAAGTLANIGGFLVSGALERQRMLGVGPLAPPRR